MKIAMPGPALDELPPPPPGKTGWPWTEQSSPLPDTLPDGSPWPPVSLVTPSYNQGQFIEETIRSVLLQGYPNLEYVVIDGGSTDDSVTVIKKYAPWLAYWVSEPDQGQSHAINKGLRRISGDIIGWLNSDDTLTVGALRRVVTYLDEAQKVDMVYGSINRIDAQSNLIRPPELSKEHREFGPMNCIGQYTVAQPGAFWRRRIMEKIGMLDKSLHYVMDYEYWVRMTLAGATLKRLPGEPVSNFRLSETSKTTSQCSGFGLELLEILNRLKADRELPGKLGLSPLAVKQQIARAQALANLRLFRAYSQEFKPVQTWRCLSRAVWLYPPVLFTRTRPILRGLWDTLCAVMDRSH